MVVNSLHRPGIIFLVWCARIGPQALDYTMHILLAVDTSYGNEGDHQ